MKVKAAADRIADRSAAIAGEQRDGSNKFASMRANPREAMLLLFAGFPESAEEIENALIYAASSARFGVEAVLDFIDDESKDPFDAAISSGVTLSFLIAQAFLVGYYVAKDETDAE